MPKIQIRPKAENDRAWIESVSLEVWASEMVIAHGDIFYPADLEGFVALIDNEKVGLLNFQIKDKACEVVMLNAARPGQGVGNALMKHIIDFARQNGCKKLWLVTSNENTRALHFYQKLGFRLTALRPGIMEKYRKIKPEIPMISEDGIPIRDEIELEMEL